MIRLRLAAAGLALLLSQTASAQAGAQATLKPDGQIRAAFGLAASYAAGNSSSSNFTVSADIVRATPGNKLSLYGRAQYARANDTTTDDQARLGTRFDHDFGESLFSYVSGDLEHNKLTNLKLRSQLGGGIGLHVFQREDSNFDIFGGLSYANDRYSAPALVDDQIRSSFSYASVMLGEESSHKVSETTSLKQRLTLLPNLKDRGEFRLNWDAGVAVAINKLLSLNVGLAFAHNSDPGLGRKANDTLVTTGISLKFD